MKLSKEAKATRGTSAVKAETSEKVSTGKIRVKQIASGAGRLQKQIATLKGLGLNKVHREVELEDTAAIRGMVNKVKHLVKIIV